MTDGERLALAASLVARLAGFMSGVAIGLGEGGGIHASAEALKEEALSADRELAQLLRREGQSS